MLFESRQTFYKCLTNAAYLIHYKINFKILGTRLASLYAVTLRKTKLF